MLWVKAFHIIAVICWFAVLFYLPRLFVYHAQATDALSNERFKLMEHKLYRQIGTPSFLLSVILGGWLTYDSWAFYKTQGWLHAKLFLVFLLIGYHHMCGAYVKKFARDANTKTHVFYRYFNEVPVVLLIAIVVLVVVKPF